MTSGSSKTVLIAFRVAEEKRRRAKAAAADEGRTLQAVLLELLEAWLSKRKAA